MIGARNTMCRAGWKNALPIDRSRTTSTRPPGAANSPRGSARSRPPRQPVRRPQDPTHAVTGRCRSASPRSTPGWAAASSRAACTRFPDPPKTGQHRASPPPCWPASRGMAPWSGSRRDAHASMRPAWPHSASIRRACSRSKPARAKHASGPLRKRCGQARRRPCWRKSTRSISRPRVACNWQRRRGARPPYFSTGAPSAAMPARRARAGASPRRRACRA